MIRPASRLLLVLVLATATAVPATAAAATKSRVTPAGWAVRPAGAEISVARTTQGFQGPLGSALSPSGQKLLSVSSAATRINSADLFDLRRRRRTGTVPYDSRRGIGEAVFYGVAFSPGGKRAWASGGGQNVVHVYSVGKGLRETGQIPTPYFPAGLAYGKTPRGDRIYVANNLGGVAGATNPPGRSVTVIDPKSNHVVKTIDLGFALQPYGVTFGRSGRRAYVTNWMGRSVSVIDTRTEQVRRRIVLSPPTRPQLADHPNAIVANPRRSEVYTANGNSDTVSIIDTRRERVIRTMAVGLTLGARPGAMPSGLAVSPDGKRLYVALGGENAIAVLDLVHRKRIGFIPTAWNPTDVDITRDGSKLAVTTANAAGRRPRRCAGPYAVGDCSTGDLAYSSASGRPSTKGGISVVRTPRTRKQLRRLTRAVLHNNRARARLAAKPPYLGAIRHVIYVVKENRTYDQVLGNIGKGDGDPALTLFDDDSAPNHRELARRFTLFDNFYADADVSADGLSWAFGAGVTDYIDKTWPITYSPGARRRQRARDFEHASFAEQFFTEPLAFDRTIFRGASALTRGYIWDNAWRSGRSFRDYGMYTRIPGDCKGAGNTSDVTHLDDRRFGDHVDERYPGFNLLCSDHADREPEWAREFSAYEAQFRADPSKDPLPALTLLRLPNDHTWGTTPKRAIPESYFADNDLALGRLVDRVSKSPFWPNTAILVTEDDAQNGPDHVDAHRTLAYVISPYTQAGRVDHTHYDTAGMVATVENLLGMPPMTIVDQRATRMWKGFSRTPNFRPYDARMPAVIPFGAEGAPVNADNAPLATASSRWNFAVEDATPEIPLNQAIWKSVNGRRSTMPAPRHDYIIGSQPADAGG
ncbi:MAG: bifunctional YncE family protein/alkaline phosphatase family protein [Solirubrobacteraceae bacterium]